MYNKKFFILLIFCCLVSISAVSADDFSDLAYDVDTAAAGDTIDLTADYEYNYIHDSSYQNGIAIARDNLTIDGNGYTIDGDKSARIFYISSKNVVLKNINFINGQVTGCGGAIYVTASGSVQIENCYFADNSINGNKNYGGAIQSSGMISIYNSTFVSNRAFGSGAVDNNNGQMTIDSCTFIDNHAVSRDAGAVSNAGGNVGTCLIKNSIFINNSAIRDGGAIKNNNEGGVGYLIVNNSTFIGNVADGELDKSGLPDAFGGAIYNWGANLIVDDSVFINNSASKWGGAVISSGGVFPSNSNIASSIFINNLADGGGAIFYGMSETVNLTYCVFLDNSIDSVYVGYATRDVNIDYNWWGTNNPDWEDVLTKERKFSNPNYLVLDAAPNPVVEYPNVDINVEFGFYTNDTAKLVLGVPARSISLFATEGNLSKANGELIGTFNTIYNADALGNYQITAIVDNEELKVPVTIVNSTDLIAEAIVNGCNVTINANVVPYSVNGNVTFVLNNKLYSVALSKGSGSVTIENVSAGNYTVELSFRDVKTTVNFTVAEDYGVVVIAPDVIKYYGGSERFVVKLVDDKNNPVANQSVTVTINGANYNRTTDNNGETSLPLNLGSGIYNVTTVYETQVINSTVTIKTTVEGNDLTKIFRNASQYHASFLDKNGNKLAGTVVSFNINGILYNRTTDENGVAQLNINLNPGEYIITAINLDNKEMGSNIITVLSNMIDNNDLTKYYRNASQYVVKVLDEQGNSVKAGETVTFNINGVFYNRTTDSTGHVQLNINLQPGEYIVTAEYKNCRVSNNIKILPVLSAADLNKTYGNKTPFTVNLVNGQGNPLANEMITFNINGVFYNRTTDANGQANLNINLLPGEYIITSSYNQANIANKVTITS